MGQNVLPTPTRIAIVRLIVGSVPPEVENLAALRILSLKKQQRSGELKRTTSFHVETRNVHSRSGWRTYIFRWNSKC